MDNFNILKARPEDLPTFTSVKNDVAGSGVDVKVDAINRIWVSYCDDASPKNVRCTYSTNMGATWSAPILVEAGVQDCQTALAFDPINRVYVFFVKDFIGTKHVAYRRSSSNGTTWEAIQDTQIIDDPCI